MLRRKFLATAPGVIGVLTLGKTWAAPVQEEKNIGAKNILDYGAKPNGKSLCSQAIQQAIDDVFRAGGGTVYGPPGTFLVAGIELKSRVTLYLDAGCTLLGSASIDDYRRGSDENGHHVIFASNAEDVTLSGPGTIDGQGPAYWESANRPPVSPENVWKDVITHSTQVKKGGRPSPMVHFEQCRNVHINGITLKNSSGRTLQLLACASAAIDGIRIQNLPIGVNTDGIDIAASRDVTVSNCDITTGDDAICLKSPAPYGDSLPTKNITVTNCRLTSSCNGFKIGTETHGAFENIAFKNSVVASIPGAPVNARVISGVSIEMADGGSIDGVVVSNIRMQNVRAPIFVRLEQRTAREGSFLRNVQMDGLDAEGATVTSSITGVAGLRPSDITVTNSRFHTVEQGRADWARREIPEVDDKYPEAWMMGHLPAYGFYLRHADRIKMRNVECLADSPDERPAIVCDDVEDAGFAELNLTAPAGGAPVFDLRNTRQVLVTGIHAPVGSKVLVQVSGAASSGIKLTANTLGPDQRAVSFANGAPTDSATVE
jgi:polygalacturonase